MKSDTGNFKDSLIIKFISSLNKQELKEFEKFVLSPLHNNRSDVSLFFKELKNYYPNFNSKNFSKETIYSRMYPGKKYRDDVIRRLSSNLLKTGEEYGAYADFRKDKFSYNRHLSNFYLSKPLPKLLSRQLSKTEEDLNKNKTRDAAYFYNVNLLEEYKRLAAVMLDPSGRKIDLQQQIDSIWKFALISLFRLYKIASVHTSQFEKTINIKNIKLLHTFVSENGFMDSTALELWYYLVMFRDEKRDNETFFKIKEMLLKHRTIFEPVESFIIYVSLLGYCYDMNLVPANDFRIDEFDIMKEMIESGHLVQDNVFPAEWFIFCVITSLRAGKTQYAEMLIKDYGKLLPPASAENIMKHSMAELEIEKGNFESALDLLAGAKNNNIAEKLRTNNMYIKIYYELGLSEQFFYSADNFKHLIKNDPSLTKDAKNIRENFIKYAVKLFRIKLGELKLHPFELKKEIMSHKILGNKWLLKKADELKKNKN